MSCCCWCTVCSHGLYVMSISTPTLEIVSVLVRKLPLSPLTLPTGETSVHTDGPPSKDHGVKPKTSSPQTCAIFFSHRTAPAAPWNNVEQKSAVSLLILHFAVAAATPCSDRGLFMKLPLTHCAVLSPRALSSLPTSYMLAHMKPLQLDIFWLS